MPSARTIITTAVIALVVVWASNTVPFVRQLVRG